MHSNSQGAQFLKRSQSGAQRKIRQKKGPEWVDRKLAQHLSTSTENLAPSSRAEHRVESTQIGTTFAASPDERFRSVVDAHDYRSVLPDLQPSHNSATDFGARLDLEEKFNEWKFPDMSRLPSCSPASHSSPIPLQTFDLARPSPKPRLVDSPQSDSAGSAPDSATSSLDDSVDLPAPLPPIPHKPMLQVHPLPVPRAKPQPPPVPAKPKNLARLHSSSSFDADKLGQLSRANSTVDLNVPSIYSMDEAALNELERQRIASLTTLYKKVGGRWEDLRNLHQDKWKNAELFQQIVDLATKRNVPTAPFVRFVKRFEMVYEVQTRLTINKQNLMRELEKSRDDEFIKPLLERNQQNLQDVERIVDELDQAFRQLDAQLCDILEPEEHETWVFFVRTLYSLIAEQSSIQSKVRSVSEQIKKLENFSFQQIIQTRFRGSSISESAQPRSPLNMASVLSNGHVSSGILT